MQSNKTKLKLNSTIYTEPQMFGSYLAGLWEGDGHITVAQSGGKPSFHITFHMKELVLAEKLLSHIELQCNANAGSIRIHAERRACVLNIYSVPGLTVVVNLIKPWLKSPKAYQIQIIALWLSKKAQCIYVEKGKSKTFMSFQNKSQDYNIIKANNGILSHDYEKSQCFDNAWLAGFVDADGSFGVEHVIETNKRRLLCRFRLLQSMTYQKLVDQQQQKALNQKSCKNVGSYEPLMSSIAAFIDVKLNLRHKPNTNKHYYLISATKASSKAKLRAYFDHYGLLSSKRLDYAAWCIVDDLMIKHMVYVNHEQTISELKRSMNRSRTSFDWTHLDAF